MCVCMWWLGECAFACGGCMHVFACGGCGHVFACGGRVHVFACGGRVHVFACGGRVHVFACVCVHVYLCMCMCTCGGAINSDLKMLYCLPTSCSHHMKLNTMNICQNIQQMGSGSVCHTTLLFILAAGG